MIGWLKKLDADDIFISYSREDGSAYLRGLDAALSERGFSCFTDKRGTDAGKLPPATLFRKVRLCKTLVLLATPCALAEPENIAPEVTEFAEANGTSRIICVSFDRDQEFADWSRTPWYTHVVGKAREREDPATLKTGEPSSAVVEAVVTASDYMKSKDRLRRYRNQALAVLGVLLFAIIGASILAGFMFRRADAAVRKANEETVRAERATQDADRATRDAQQARSQAEAAQREARSALESAEIAKADALEQKRLADVASERARTAQRNAAEQQARANHQQAIAKVRSLANSSQTLLRRQPEDVERSLSRAVEAMELSDSIKLHILEADTALRESLALMPRLRDSKKHPPDAIVALSPDGGHFAIRDPENKKVQIYAHGSETVLKEIACECPLIALSSGAKVVAGVTDGVLKIFDLNDDTRSFPSKNTEAASADKIALSPSGKYLAFTLLEGEDVDTHSVVRVIDVATGTVIKSFDDLDTKVNDIAFGPTGNLAVAGKYTVPQGGQFTGRVILWNLASDETLTEMQLTADSFPKYEVISMAEEITAVAPGHISLATDKILWKKTPGADRYRRAGVMPYSADETTSSVRMMAFSKEGQTLTLVRHIQPVGDSVADEEDALESWETSGHEELVRILNQDEVRTIVFRPGSVVMTIGDDAGDTARLFSALDGKPQNTVRVPPLEGENVTYTNAKNGYEIAATENEIVIFDVAAGRRQTAKLANFKKVEAAALSPAGDFLALSGKNNKDAWEFAVYRSDGSSFSEWKRFENPYEPVEMMSLSADGKRLATLHHYDTNYVRVWDVTSAQEITPKSLRYIREVETENFASIPDMFLIAMSHTGRFLMTADRRNRTWLVDLSKESDAQNLLLLNDRRIESASFSADDRYLGLGSDEGMLHVFDLMSTEGITEIANLQHNGKITAVAFSDDNKYVATASSDRHAYRLNEEESYPVRIWLLDPKELLKQANERLESLHRSGP